MRRLLLIFLMVISLFISSFATEPPVPLQPIPSDPIVKSQEQAFNELFKKANSGDAEAMYELGDIYYFGDGVSEDPNEAAKWYSKAIEAFKKDAEAGNSDSMFEVGKMYEYAEGVTQDIDMAIKWYHKAAEAGNAEAMLEIANIYYDGYYVEQDYTKAMEWFQKAAEHENSTAMYNLGLMYETGKGVEKDFEQAKYWYSKAVELGDDKAKMRTAFILIKKFYKIVLWSFLAALLVGGFIFGREKSLPNDDSITFEIVNEPSSWSMGRTFRRYVGALFIYLIYWLTLWGSMVKVVGASLSPDKAQELVEIGEVGSVWEYGWGDHYIWFLIAFCFVTYCCAGLAGATAKKKGALVASLANLPIVIFSLLFCWLFYIDALGITVESPVAWKIVGPLAVVGSIFFSILGGYTGKDFQETEFGDSTILGIPPVHWLWIWLVSTIYIQEIVYAVIPLFSWSEDFVSLVHVLRLLICGYPMVLMYQILSGEILARKNVFIRIISFIGIYIGGIIAGALFQLLLFGISKLLSFIF